MTKLPGSKWWADDKKKKQQQHDLSFHLQDGARQLFTVCRHHHHHHPFMQIGSVDVFFPFTVIVPKTPLAWKKKTGDKTYRKLL